MQMILPGGTCVRCAAILREGSVSWWAERTQPSKRHINIVVMDVRRSTLGRKHVEQASADHKTRLACAAWWHSVALGAAESGLL